MRAQMLDTHGLQRIRGREGELTLTDAKPLDKSQRG
jgi:hypothetical protein